MIFPPAERAATVVNASVTLTPALAATRSPAAIVNDTEVVCVNIPPEAAPADATESASVCTAMPVLLPAVAAPIVTPLRVMVKAVAAPMPLVAVVMTI